MLKLRIFVLMVVLLSLVSSVRAQDNLLPNGGLEEDSFGQYTGRRSGDFPIYLPNGWSYWFAAQNGERYNRGDRTAIRPHPGPGPSVKEGRRALNIDCGFFTCTAAVFSQVNNITVGANLQLSAFAQVKACNLQKNAQGQIIADNCGSAIESGAQTRVGIDPNGGTDPNDVDVVWSAFIAPHEQGGWQQMSTSVTATGTTITVFLYSTQSSFADINKTYWDEVRLVVGGTGGANPAAATAVPTAPPFVAFVVPQGAQADGSIIHTVQTGDTVDSIAYAYGVSRQQILDLNGIRDGRIITVGQRLIVKPPESAGSGSISAGGPPDEATAEVTAEVGVPDTTAEAAPNEPTTEPPAVAVSPAPTEQPQEAAAVEPSATPLTPIPTVALPTAPVVVADAGSIDPVSTNGTVCVTFFDDADQNRLQEQGEALLAGGTISILQGANAAGSYQTDGVSEPHCFESLAAGDYVAAAVAPDGFGLTTPDQLRLRLNPGATINITFGAAQGVQPIVPPPADANPVVEEVTQQAEPQRTLADQLMSVSGLIVFGLAAVVLVGGVGLALLLRRR
ncbi:MAG: LysM peptidoglycan-binding domain-containing protein [Anaerolineae bacterium]|nr:LysM peptidoglycan-binding domain-containing protein [Anaerolineae bacterium]